MHKMKPTIKPPKGYRLLRDGEVIRATDLVYTFPYQSSDGIKSVFKWQKLDRFDEQFIGKKEDTKQSYRHACIRKAMAAEKRGSK